MVDKDITNQQSMPNGPEPYWREQLNFPTFDSLNEDISADVAVVGAGITGITTAYLLSQEGLSVVLVDAGVILNGTTGHTTAKITAQHGLIYDELIGHFGEEQAKQYYQANDQARRFIKETINSHGIECDFEEHDSYIYTNSDQELTKLEKEAHAYERLGIPGKLVSSMPLNVPMQRAIVMEKQAQFHPLKYLVPLVEAIKKAGGKIFEHTTAVDIEAGTRPKVKTRANHTISCQHVISCSHFPFYDHRSLYFARLYPERAYVLAVKSDQPYPGGMYLNAETPNRSVRSTPYGDDHLLLVSGDSHKTGQGKDTMKHYEALASFAKDNLGMTDFRYRWSAQDLYTLDKVPYVGQMTSGQNSILVATGYRKWGMTNGTNAALLLKDLVMTGKHHYDVFAPSRFTADPDVKTFVKENMDVASELIKGKVDFNRKYPADVEIGEGAQVSVNGRKAGAYRDEKGELYIVDTTCTHMNCEVEWNAGDTTWDCPCHGSRYSIAGDVVEGPAKHPLTRLEENKS